ncbi:MAG: DUF2298 domain-containing protein [Chloroflexota bacterium]
MIQGVVWLLTVQALGLAALPLTMHVFTGLPDRGYGMSRIVGIVVVGWLAYLTAMLGFTSYVGGTVLVLAVLLGLGVWGTWWQSTLPLLRARRRLLAAEELTFLLVFGIATFVRAYNADIIGQEKFMDFAFLNALLRTDRLPAEDMWLAGYAMPYYYFGYLLAGLPAKIVGTPAPMAYSLGMVLVFSLAFGAATSVVYALVSSVRTGSADGTRLSPVSLGFGVLGGVLTMVVGNLVGPFELIAARGRGDASFWATIGVKGLNPVESPTWLPVDGGWWWRSSRVIANIQPDGITEFPYFSFILGDLHPHYVAIPFGLLIVGLAVSRWLDRESLPGLPFLAVTGLSMATLVPASTWDVPTFWGLLMLALLVDAWRRSDCRSSLIARLPALAIPPAIAIVAVVPYFVGYQSQALGLELVQNRTPLVSMLILFGPALLVALVFAVWLASRQTWAATDRVQRLGRTVMAAGALMTGLSVLGQPTLAILMTVVVALAGALWPHLVRPGASSSEDVAAVRPPAVTLPAAALVCALLGIWALCVLIGTEIIFIRDVFGSRMNTVFKFHYHAWLLLGIASAAGLGLIWRMPSSGTGWRVVAAVIAVAILAPGLVYPIGATWTKSNGFRGDPTLMGDRFLERGAPADYQAIEWLKQNADGRPVVVEAVGGSYTEHARVSTFSGLPTIIGWAGHESQWRGDNPEYGPRQQAVDTIYRSDNREEVLQIAQRYRVRYVFFGNLERAKYGADAQTRLDRMFPPAFSRSGTTIYLVEPQ